MKTYPEVTTIPTDENLCWSSDGEDFSCDSLGEMLDQAGGPIGPIVYLADKEPLEVSEFLRADATIDQMRDMAIDDSDAAESWAMQVVATEIAIAELQSALDAWAAKHLPPMNIYRHTNIRQYTLTQDDVIE